MNKGYFAPGMTPAEIIATALRAQRGSANVLWLVVGATSGRVLTWTVDKWAAKREALKFHEPTLLARVEPPKEHRGIQT